MRYGCTAPCNLYYEIKLFAVSERERTANDVVREAAALQKARAARLFVVARGSTSILAREDRSRALFFTARCDALDDRLGHAARLEIVADLRHAVLRAS
jgi:hypothetical protein